MMDENCGMCLGLRYIPQRFVAHNKLGIPAINITEAPDNLYYLLTKLLHFPPIKMRQFKGCHYGPWPQAKN